MAVVTVDDEEPFLAFEMGSEWLEDVLEPVEG